MFSFLVLLACTEYSVPTVKSLPGQLASLSRVPGADTIP